MAPLLPNGASSNPKRFDPGGHTCTENFRLSAACESEFSKGLLRVSNLFLKCRSERRGTLTKQAEPAAIFDPVNRRTATAFAATRAGCNPTSLHPRRAAARS